MLAVSMDLTPKTPIPSAEWEFLVLLAEVYFLRSFSKKIYAPAQRQTHSYFLVFILVEFYFLQ